MITHSFNNIYKEWQEVRGLGSTFLGETGVLADTTPAVVLLEKLLGVLFVITVWFCLEVSCQTQLKQADMALTEGPLNIAFYQKQCM